MRENNIKRINEYIENIDMEGIKINLKEVNRHISCFLRLGEEDYREIYHNSIYSLDELKYFEKMLKRRKKELKMREKIEEEKFLKRTRPYDFI